MLWNIYFLFAFVLIILESLYLEYPESNPFPPDSRLGGRDPLLVPFPSHKWNKMNDQPRKRKTIAPPPPPTPLSGVATSPPPRPRGSPSPPDHISQWKTALKSVHADTPPCFPACRTPNCLPQCPLLVVPLRCSGGRGAPASGSPSRITSSTNRHLAAQPVSTSSSYPPSQYHRFSHPRTTPVPDHLHSAPTSASRLVATLVPYSSSSLLAHQPNQF